MKILILGGNGMIGHKLYQVISKKYPNTWVLFKKKYELVQNNLLYFALNYMISIVFLC